jgi:adenylate cyclase class 2
MLEIEVKYPVADWDSVERKIREWKAEVDDAHEEADRYFNAPDRDFAKTDEAVRIRQIGHANLVTYKGPKTDAQTKTRTEIEVPLAMGEHIAEEFGRLLIHLGYRPVAIVRKRRVPCHLRRDGFDVEVCLDNVESVGKFVELEILAPSESLAAAKAVLLKMADELGLQTQERRSYLELLLLGQK